MPDVYGSDVYAYLGRARKQLDAATSESLFYAAFELRCGIESRLQQYLDARSDIAKSKKKGWKIVNSERELGKAFSDARKIVEVILRADSIKGEFRLFHTPIGPGLAKDGADHLSNLLHVIKQNRALDDPWWTRERVTLERIFAELELAACGTLLAPPVMRGSQVNVSAFFHESLGISPIATAFVNMDRGCVVKPTVKLHSSLPSDAAEFLNSWRFDLPNHGT